MPLKGLTGGSAYNNARLGIERGARQLTKAAKQVANANGSPVKGDDVSKGLLEARSATQQIEAAAKSLGRADDALGRFIDTLV